MTSHQTVIENQTRSLQAEGRVIFDRAFFLAFWEEIREQLQHKPVGLLSYDEVKAKLHLSDQTYKGLQEIPLDRIVGSVGRYKDFTRNFLPKNPEMAHRWANVYAHMNNLEGLPAIDVFQVDDVYFVRDGNHRVSIARQTGLETIEAYVTEMHTPIDLEPNMTNKQLDAAAAYGHFLERTRLDVNRPEQQAITLTEPAHYHNLLDHVQMVRQFQSHHQQREIAFGEAACLWYDTVYAPCVELIERYNVIERFPKRTAADLYMWVINHFQKLMNHYGDETELKLSDALVEFLGANHIPVPKRLINENDTPINS